MSARRIFLGCLSLFIAGAIGFVLSSRRQESLNTLVVRTYKVAPDQADSLKNSINSLLWTKDTGDGGRAQVFGSGLVLVRAPLGYHQGIRYMIDQMEHENPQARQRIRLECFVVMSQTGKSNAGEFREIANVLGAIEKVDGPSHFKMLEHLASVSLSGEESIAEGSLAKMVSTTALNQGKLDLKVGLDSWFGKIKTNTQIQPGEFLLLGQNAQHPHDRTQAFGEGNVYYIVRAEVQK